MKSSRFLVLALLGLAACGDAPADTGTSHAGSSSARAVAATSSASTKTSASAAATPALPADVDPTVVSELKKFQACSLKPGFGFDFGCAADEPTGFKAFADKYVAGDSGKDAAKVQKLGKTCLAMIADADVKVRLGAAGCLREGFSPRVDKTAVDPLLAALDSEKAPEVRERLALVIGGLEIAGKDATRAVELIKKLKPAVEDRSIVASLLEGLKRGEPNDAAIDEALLLAGDEHYATGGYALELLEHLKTRTDDACKAVEAVVVDKKKRWAAAASTLVRIDPACKPDFDKVVTAIADKLSEDDTETRLYRGSKILEVAHFVEKAKLSAAQKAKLSKAVATRKGKKLEGEDKELEELEKKLKK